MKPIKAIVKLQLPGGAATPGQQIGQALGQHGLNLAEFCSKFNAATSDKIGDVIPVEITIYQDQTYDFVTKTPPASDLLKKAAGIEKGSGNPLKDKVGKVTKAQIREIAEKKMADLNAEDIDAAMKIVEGSARSMGIKVE